MPNPGWGVLQGPVSTWSAPPSPISSAGERLLYTQCGGGSIPPLGTWQERHAPKSQGCRVGRIVAEEKITPLLFPAIYAGVLLETNGFCKPGEWVRFLPSALSPLASLSNGGRTGGHSVNRCPNFWRLARLACLSVLKTVMAFGS